MKTIIAAVLAVSSTVLPGSAQEVKRPAAEAAKEAVRHADAAAAKKLIDGSTDKAKITVRSPAKKSLTKPLALIEPVKAPASRVGTTEPGKRKALSKR